VLPTSKRNATLWTKLADADLDVDLFIPLFNGCVDGFCELFFAQLLRRQEPTQLALHRPNFAFGKESWCDRVPFFAEKGDLLTTQWNRQIPIFSLCRLADACEYTAAGPCWRPY